MKRALAALILAAAFFVAWPTSPGTALVACPATSLTRTGNQTTAINQSATDATWDLTGATWDRNTPVPLYSAVRSDAVTRACIKGGSLLGNTPRSATRDCWYNGTGCTRYNGNGYDLSLTNTTGNYAQLTDTYVSDIEDAYDPDGKARSAMLTIDHGHTEFIRDDCLENEGPSGDLTRRPISVMVNNSLFDGCFTAFAERPPGSSTAQNGTGAQTFTVSNSLVYANPQPLGPAYCSSTSVSRGRCLANGSTWLGNYGIWKWSNEAAAKVSVSNTIFRLDVASYSSCQSQKWPAGTYSNVTLVWTGAGPYATAGGCTNVLPAGVTLTTDVTVWDNAKAAWLGGNPSSLPPSPSCR